MFAQGQAPFTCAASFFMTLQPLLVSLSKNERGTFDYSMPASTLLSESLKLCISGSLLVSASCQTRLKLLHDDSLSEFFSFMIPGLIYFLNNNMIFLILQAVDPTTFQLLSQLKTIFTGLLFRVFLNRRLSYVQWLALVTLACGTAVSQIPTHKVGKRQELETQAMLGVGLSILSSFLSACGGIYNEKLLKGRPSASLHWQNVQMYIWGVLFNGIGAYLKDGEAMRQGGVLAGFSLSAWAVVACNALNGLAISAVLKYADNIARVYAHAIAMMLTMSLSVQLFGAPVTPQLVIAVVLVATSTLQYNLPSDVVSSSDEKSALLSAEERADAVEAHCVTPATKPRPTL
ncbi:hypothetical protein AB1Y20_016451 [Prymnesium parvum]|uniref:CMP-sialic acid transporter n=1 Tax=Prymnesium parvum TaxID=97485 RepID=A0AB34IFA4_PRYPA